MLAEVCPFFINISSNIITIYYFNFNRFTNFFKSKNKEEDKDEDGLPDFVFKHKITGQEVKTSDFTFSLIRDNPTIGNILESEGAKKLEQIINNDNRKIQACIEKGIECCIIDTSSSKNFKPDRDKLIFFRKLF